MKKWMGIILLLTALLAGCGDEKPEVSKVIPLKEYLGITDFRIVSEDESNREMEVDAFGNVIYTNNNGSETVIPFQNLTQEQIKLYEEKGEKFPARLLDEKKENESNK